MSDQHVPEHPGKIIFMEGDTILHEKDANDVPFGIRFVETPDGLVPVVKVVAITTGNQRRIHQYGPDGQLLETTLQIRD
jgi:hypothetical protein